MDESTLDSIANFICGNEDKHPIYRSSSHLTAFFERAMLPQFKHDGSTRQIWVLNCLKECNEHQIESVILRLASPKEYAEDKDVIKNVISQLNEILYFEELKIIFRGVNPVIQETSVDINTNILNDKENIYPKLKPEDNKKLIKVICDCLSSESANNLHVICKNYGLDEGTREDAYGGKKSYVYSRISHFNLNELWDLAKKMQGKYSYLDELIDSIEDADPLKLKVSFDDQKRQIINAISDARFTIWVAVAWFTEKDFADALWRKQKEGVNIQIIVIDDDKNTGDWFKYFDVYKLPPTGKFNYNIMHSKFCVIDLKTVIQGSYNWTKSAEFNNETIQITSNKKEAEKFAEEFVRLKSEYISIKGKTAYIDNLRKSSF